MLAAAIPTAIVAPVMFAVNAANPQMNGMLQIGAPIVVGFLSITIYGGCEARWLSLVAADVFAALFFIVTMLTVSSVQIMWGKQVISFWHLPFLNYYFWFGFLIFFILWTPLSLLGGVPGIICARLLRR